MATVELTGSTFESTIRDNDIVLVDFWAEWCGPCRVFGPIFERVSDGNPDVVFGKVDTDAESELAAAAGIRSIPTLMIFRDGIQVYRDAGALPASVLEDLVEQVRGLDMDAVRSHLHDHDHTHAHDHAH